MKLYRCKHGPVVEYNETYRYLPRTTWDDIFAQQDVVSYLEDEIRLHAEPIDLPPDPPALVPVSGQEVWAAGVTYYRSRDARMAESEKAGGGSFYDKVYDAERPELFFKGNARTVVGPDMPVRIRSDSSWNVPEPELALAVSANGRIFGFTIGNDLSSRDIEGANPLYLPQAKVYDGSCALGPAIRVGTSIAQDTGIHMTVTRNHKCEFTGTTEVREIKRPLEELVRYLYLDNTFPAGCFLLTGTGIIPPDDFTLQSGDLVSITIDTIGTLTNTVG